MSDRQLAGRIFSLLLDVDIIPSWNAYESLVRFLANGKNIVLRVAYVVPVFETKGVQVCQIKQI